MIRLIFLAILVICSTLADLAHATPPKRSAKQQSVPAVVETKSPVDQLKQRFLRLRNTDPNVRKLADWQEVGAQFEQLGRRSTGQPGSAMLMLNAGIAYMQIAAQYQDPDYGNQAKVIFKKLTHDYGQRSEGQQAARYLNQMNGKAPPIASRSPQAPKSVGGPLIVIDPGHGGEDFGAIGQGGLLEKDVTLAVALKLEQLLISRMQATVRLTRRSDSFVALAERTNLANDSEAALFISLHANASPEGKLAGLETYYLDNTDDQASHKLAERENESTRFEGAIADAPTGDLQFMLSDLIQNGKLDDSIIAANRIHKSLIARLAASKQWPELISLGVKRAPFYVLVGAHMPCVLVEMFFIDNPIEGRYLGTAEFQNALAEGLYAGIAGYFNGKRR